jgi:hypothetical protein
MNCRYPLNPEFAKKRPRNGANFGSEHRIEYHYPAALSRALAHPSMLQKTGNAPPPPAKGASAFDRMADANLAAGRRRTPAVNRGLTNGH